MVKNRKKYENLVILVLLASLFFLYSVNYTKGALGNDSPGYLYVADRLANSLPVTYEEPLVPLAINLTGNISSGEAVTPHFAYKILNYESGLISPKIQIGFPLYLSFMQVFFGQQSIYLFSMVLIIISILLAITIFQNLERKDSFRLILLVLLAFNINFWSTAISEPMTEITSIFFITLAFFLEIKYFKKSSIPIISLAGFILGIALWIKITNILFFPLFIYVIFIKEKKIISKHLGYLFIFIAIGFLSIYLISPDFANIGVKKSTELENFVSYADTKHFSGLSLQNFYDNSGKYKRGYGSFYWYIYLLKNKLILQPALILIILGMVYLLYTKRAFILLGIILAISPVILFYSLWVNPYDRYIFPTIIPLSFLSLFGVIFVYKKIKKLNKIPRIMSISTLILLFIILNLITFTTISGWVSNSAVPSRNYVNEETLQAITEFSSNIEKENSIFIFSKGLFTQATFFEVHTHVKSIKVSSQDVIKFIESNDFKKIYKNTYLFVSEEDMNDYKAENLNNCEQKEEITTNYKIKIFKC